MKKTVNVWEDGWKSAGNAEVILKTRKDNEEFFGDFAIAAAIQQAKALSCYYAGSGCYKVYSDNDFHAAIMYDECNTRDGVADDCIFKANQHCNSGTYSWVEARTFEINN